MLYSYAPYVLRRGIKNHYGFITLLVFRYIKYEQNFINAPTTLHYMNVNIKFIVLFIFVGYQGDL